MLREAKEETESGSRSIPIIRDSFAGSETVFYPRIPRATGCSLLVDFSDSLWYLLVILPVVTPRAFDREEFFLITCDLFSSIPAKDDLTYSERRILYINQIHNYGLWMCFFLNPALFITTKDNKTKNCHRRN